MKAKWIWLAAGIALGGVFNAVAETTSDALTGNRFLFVVETSSSSSRLEHGGRQAAFDLIYTGVYGQMQAGDTFGLWTFNQIVYAGVYPMQTWNSETTMELASNAGQFLKNQHYEKSGKLGNVLKQVMSMVRTVKDLNILIVSDPGGRPDDVIGPGYPHAYEERGTEARAAKSPLITTIVARSGSISNWFVTLPGEPIQLPSYAIPPRPIVKSVPTNSPTPQQLVKTAPKPEPRPLRSSIIIKGAAPVVETTATETNEPRASFTLDPPPHSKFGTVLSSSSSMTLFSSLQTNVPASTVPNEKPIEPPTANPALSQKITSAPGVIVSAPRNPSPTVKPIESPKPVAQPKQDDHPPAQIASAEPKTPKPAALVSVPPVKVSARERTPTAQVEPSKSEAQIPQQPALSPAQREKPEVRESAMPPVRANNHTELNAVVTPPSSPDRSVAATTMIIIGGVLLALAVLLTGWFMRHLRRPVAVSFISQSMERR